MSMNRIWLMMFCALCPLVAIAQTGPSSSGDGRQPYQPVVPPPTVVSPFGGPYYGYGGGASTAAGSALNGMGNLMSAIGQRNLMNSAAAVNMTQAQRNEIQNRNLATNTYFQMRATNHAARQAESAPPPTMEQLTRIAKEGVPKQLSPSQMDHVHGRLNWPGPLQQPVFDQHRRQIDELFEKRARYGGLDYADQTAVRHAVDAMTAQLKEQVNDIPPQEYVACKNFLQSTLYSATKNEL
jgi:type II secretory pathway pseudopilin PulG